MSSFQNLQAIAAARAKAQEEKLAAERAAKQRQEAERKAEAEAKEHKRLQQERQAFVAREQRKKQEAEAARQRAEDEQRAKEQASKRRHEEEVKRLQLASHDGRNGRTVNGSHNKGAGSTSSADGAIDMKSFASASRKALARAGSQSSSRKAAKLREVEDKDGFIRAREPTNLSREEKRQRRERAIFGVDGGSSSTRKGKTAKNGLIAPAQGGHLPGTDMHAELVALGQHKRDKRTIEEIERDLRTAKMEARSTSSDKMQVKAAARQEAELEAMLRRKRAMETKKRMELGDAGASPLTSRPPTASLPSQSSSSSTSQSQPAAARTTALGLTAADYLPGAPVRRDISQPSRKVDLLRTTTDGAPSQRTAEPRQESPAVRDAPRKRETARDRFLREEAERKARQKQSAASQQFNEDDAEEDDEESESVDDDEYESEDDASQAGPDGEDFREEIWKLFGRDRKAYTAHRDDDSDDDMEADLASVAREEARSARLARLEDAQEERRELQRLADKQARKKARLEK